MKKRIVAISDTHMKHHKLRLPEGDILIHAGDFCNFGKRQEVRNFAQWLNYQPFKYKLISCGNHDDFCELEAKEAKSMFNFPNTHLLINEEINIDGIKIYCSPYTPIFYDWAFMLERDSDKLKACWDLIPEKLDIVITHGPPKKILDYVSSSQEHVGDGLLLKAVMEKVPFYHIFGHIHRWKEDNKIEIHNGITFINASSCDDNYKLVNPPIVFDIEVNNDIKRTD